MLLWDDKTTKQVILSHSQTPFIFSLSGWFQLHSAVYPTSMWSSFLPLPSFVDVCSLSLIWRMSPSFSLLMKILFCLDEFPACLQGNLERSQDTPLSLSPLSPSQCHSDNICLFFGIEKMIFFIKNYNLVNINLYSWGPSSNIMGLKICKHKRKFGKY